MIRAGRPAPLGASTDDEGTNFAVYSGAAERIELCLFDAAGHQTRSHELPACDAGVWHGRVPGCRAGQRYGYRVYGRYAPGDGLRCNPAKLLLDPYARELDGAFTWHDAVFDYDSRTGPDAMQINTIDSAPYVPKSVVREADEPIAAGPRVPWGETIFYEINVRGYTMQHPALDESLRGRFAGLRHNEILDYLKALGITSLELMPVHAFIDEYQLARRGLRNFWGYNSISFFAPTRRYSQSDAIAEFRDMVRAIHDAGIEVILDVVYNHTGESDSLGPTLCFRGFDNLCYYSTEPGRPGVYINDTGCGNTLNVDHPAVRRLVLDSLRYWHQEMGVDGFRFDLAPVLGRHNHGYSSTHPMLKAIGQDRELVNAKLIAEPWDPGPGGYQLGSFPTRWSEWNDRYRDTVRRFWRGDDGVSAELGERLRGSADIFESSARPPTASINYVSSHDGFTLADVVSFERRHNEANGEGNQDGHAHNYSANYGVEGATDDVRINAARRQQRLNMLATLLLSQGTPLILGGDEFGNSQAGNNNAYAQDNETGWIDWSGLTQDPEFTGAVRNLIELRRQNRLLRIADYVHGALRTDEGVVDIRWLGADAEPIADHEWSSARVKNILLTITESTGNRFATAILLNGLDEACKFVLPEIEMIVPWQLLFHSAPATSLTRDAVSLPGMSLAAISARGASN